jgi:HD-like signal output (HDOD) protein
MSGNGLADVVRGLYETGRIALPPLPDVVVELQVEMSRPEPSTSKLARVVAQDPVLAAGVLQIANSAFYGARGLITGVEPALLRIGLSAFRSLLMAQLARRLHGAGPAQVAEPMRALWRHGLSTAVAARQIGIRCGFRDPDELFLVGLFHDVGSSLILWALAAMGQLVPEPRLGQALARYHEHVGADLLRGWHLPEVVVRCSGAHHRADVGTLARDKTLAALILAEHVAASVAPPVGEAAPAVPADTLVRILGLSEIARADVEIELELRIAEFAGALAAQPRAEAPAHARTAAR